MDQAITTLKKKEYEAVMLFVDFLSSKDYGEFNASINTDKRRSKRDILITVSDKTKISINK